MIDRTRSLLNRFESIRTKLLLYAAVVLVIPTLVYGVSLFSAAREALEPSLRAELADTTVTVKAAVQEFLSGHVQNIKTWARLDIMRELVIDDIDKTISHFLEGVKNEYGVYLAILAVDNAGVCRASSDPALIGKKFEKELANGFDHGQPGSEAVTPQIAYEPKHRVFYIALATPIPDPDHQGAYLGTLIAMLSRSSPWHIVRPKPGQRHAQLYLLDGSDRIIAGPGAADSDTDLGRWRVDARGRIFPGHRRPPVLYRATSPAGEPLLVGDTVLDEYRGLPALDWHVVATVPRSVVLAPVRRVRNQVFLLGSAVTLAGMALAWLLSSNLSRPIKHLTRITTRIADTGVLEDVPKPTSRDEIGELATSFGKMVRNIAVAQEQLVHSAKLAFLGEMAAGMAHEIRTPLGIIKNSAQLLERRMRQTDDSEGIEFATFVYEETDRLNAVVTDLLSFARPAPPDKSPAQLNSVVEKAMHLLRSEASAKHVDVRLHLAPNLPSVVCDAGQIRQVCINLVMNAVQACGGGGTVEISTSSVANGVEIVVCDNGPGIQEEIRDNLFAPFATKREGGIGLGLAIVQRIVTAHTGQIEAGNQGEGGARFRVWLPLEAADHGSMA